MERSILVERPWSWRTFFLQWEWLLVLIFIVVNIVNSTLSPYYFTVDTFLQTPMSFLDKAFIVLPMTMVIILGNIDISVGSVLGLSAYLSASLFSKVHGIPILGVFLVGLAIGLACGALNGAIVSIARVPSLVVTLATLYIFRALDVIIVGGGMVVARC